MTKNEFKFEPGDIVVPADKNFEIAVYSCRKQKFTGVIIWSDRKKFKKGHTSTMWDVNLFTKKDEL